MKLRGKYFALLSTVLDNSTTRSHSVARGTIICELIISFFISRYTDMFRYKKILVFFGGCVLTENIMCCKMINTAWE